jgi:hypothetical protein
MSKGRKENLIDTAHRTEEELRAMTRKGGIKSGEARRRKKTMREALEFLMYKAELSEALKQRMRDEGIKDEDMNHQMAITRSLIAKAEAGDVQAYNAICAMIGEKPAEKVEMSGGTVQTVNIRHIGEKGDEVFPSSEDEVDATR